VCVPKTTEKAAATKDTSYSILSII